MKRTRPGIRDRPMELLSGFINEMEVYIFMRTLEFTVERQRLTKKKDCDFSKIVAGTSGYLQAKFYFSPIEWGGCKKVASFWLNDEEFAAPLGNDNTCIIPSEALTGKKFVVSVTGIRPGTDYRIKSDRITVKQEVYR